MKRWLCLAVAGALTLIANLADAQADKMTVKEVMGRVNKGPTALFPMVQKGLNAPDPAWNDVQKQTKELADLVEGLVKKDPPRGEKESWVKHVKGYAEGAKALDTAAQKKDKDTALAVHKKMTDACTACHRLHRPN